MSGLEIGLLSSAIVVAVIAIVALVIINFKAGKIKKQVLDGTYVSKKQENTEDTIEIEKTTEEDSNDVSVEETAEEQEEEKNDEIEKKDQNIDYSELTVSKLKEILKEKNIEFKSSMKKQELIDLLTNN